MLTQCPSCQTVFRVTGAVLRMAHGQVRCGRCSTQFDALERLVDDTQTDEFLAQQPGTPEPFAPGDSALHTDGSGQIEVDEPASMEEITLEGKRIEISGTYRVMGEPGSDEHPHTRTIVEEWTVMDEDEDHPPSSVGPTTSVIDSAGSGDTNAANTGEPYGENDAEAAEDRAMLAAAARQTLQPPVAQATDIRGEVNDDPDDLTFGREKSRASGTWAVASLFLALLLIAQVVHHYRQELARHPAVGPPLGRLYAGLGLPLMPNWDLTRYELKQWGVISDPNASGTLRVRASITNRATFAQPYPLLQLTLEDRWGAGVGQREFEPAEYLSSSAAAGRMLAPGQSANTEIAIVDPGADAVGFRVDICMRRDSGMVCSGDGTGS